MRVSRRAVGLTVAFVAIAALGGFTFLQMRAADAAGEHGADSTDVARRVAATADSGGSASSVAIPVERCTAGGVLQVGPRPPPAIHVVEFEAGLRQVRA